MDYKIIQGDARNLSLKQFSKYGVIVADPPWEYDMEIGRGKALDQYNLLTMEEIASMPIPELAKPDCILFLWGTWPKLPYILNTLKAWQFEYVTGFPWVKTSQNNAIQYGVGYWVRGCSEFIFIGRRGNVKPPKQAGFLGLLSPNLHHSRKPDSVHEIAEALPGPYLELFARRPRVGWTVFGNELEDFIQEPRKKTLVQQIALGV